MKERVDATEVQNRLSLLLYLEAAENIQHILRFHWAFFFLKPV
jgi:hypothetical protein